MRIFWLLPLFLTTGCFADKDAHFLAGGIINQYVQDRTGSPIAGCAASILFGIAKEAYDRNNGGVVDRGDVVATGASCNVNFTF